MIGQQQQEQNMMTRLGMFLLKKITSAKKLTLKIFFFCKKVYFVTLKIFQILLRIKILLLQKN